MDDAGGVGVGLVNVDVEVASYVQNIVKGNMTIEVNLNEKDVDEKDNESIVGVYTQRKSNDKGLSNDD